MRHSVGHNAVTGPLRDVVMIKASATGMWYAYEEGKAEGRGVNAQALLERFTETSYMSGCWPASRKARVPRRQSNG